MLRALNGAGAVFLLWLAWKIASAPPGEAAAGATAVGFVEAAAFQWINPKSWLVCASAVSTYLGAGSATGQAVTFGGLFVAASLPCCFVWLASGATAQRGLRPARLQPRR